MSGIVLETGEETPEEFDAIDSDIQDLLTEWYNIRVKDLDA